MKEYGMYQSYNVEASMGKEEMEASTPTYGTEMSGCTMPEVTECVQERQIHRTILRHLRRRKGTVCLSAISHRGYLR